MGTRASNGPARTRRDEWVEEGGHERRSGGVEDARYTASAAAGPLLIGGVGSGPIVGARGRRGDVNVCSARPSTAREEFPRRACLRHGRARNREPGGAGRTSTTTSLSSPSPCLGWRTRRARTEESRRGPGPAAAGLLPRLGGEARGSPPGIGTGQASVEVGSGCNAK